MMPSILGLEGGNTRQNIIKNEKVHFEALNIIYEATLNLMLDLWFSNKFYVHQCQAQKNSCNLTFT